MKENIDASIIEKAKKFNSIGDVIAKELNIEKIFLDVFINIYNETSEYIVVQFKGGGISVRNAACNSLSCNIRELSKMLDGGYYEELKDYYKLKGVSS